MYEDILAITIKLILELVIFLGLVGIGLLIAKLIPKSNHKIFNPTEYLPEDEIHTLKQVLYLSLMAACFISVLYAFIFNGHFIYFAGLDVLLSVYIAVTVEMKGWRRIVTLILLVPYASLTYIIFGYSMVEWVEIIHIPIMVYFIKYYYDRFTEYTQTNSLGITILLLFSIVFFSSLNTIFVESKNPLDALVMSSNAFTSNGYAVLGQSVLGKINSLILVWSGFIISGVGTATLTLALSTRHYNKKFDEMNSKIDELKELIEEKKE